MHIIKIHLIFLYIYIIIINMNKNSKNTFSLKELLKKAYSLVGNQNESLFSLI